MSDQAAVSATQKEEQILQSLVATFPQLRDHIRVARVRRIFATVDALKFDEMLSYAIEKLGFVILCTITGLDNGATLGFVYHLGRLDGIALSIQIDVPKDNPVIRTITRYFSCAEIYERELIDLLGAKVEGLGKGIRYPLPDNWPVGEYPLRKDWKMAEKSGEARSDA